MTTTVSTPDGPMSQYNIAEAKVQLSELTRRALAGEEVIIARDNTPWSG